MTSPSQLEEFSEHGIGAVVVAYMSAGTIESCVTSCLADPLTTAVVVIDNSSDRATESIVSAIAQNDCRVRYRAVPNLGFSRGCNLGAAMCDTPWIAFVNPDVVLDRPLSELARALDTTSFSVGAGILQTQGGRAHGINCRLSFSVRRELLAVAMGPTRVYSPRFALGVDGWTRVGQLAGALLVMRTATFQRIGGFDERFELYYDDVDLAVNLEAFGGSGLLHVPWGTHFAGQSSRSVPHMSYVVGKVSRVRFLAKHYSRWRAALAALSIAVTEWAARTLARRPEGQSARNEALRLQTKEVFRPGVKVLK
ncbi:glycosyl transferase [Nocardioides flavus (ex Wang et al. 2016)]|uniref:Glycosyl transferase n=1 Tax=Nocardioides flavus (ex Wang et al. 2016) TaxID=2058780 RepID=A0ABQ3HGA7_9ACTN|nr:glycosyl transferase [Nocardioides flavus (ex Wang et al. 2016)]